MLLPEISHLISPEGSSELGLDTPLTLAFNHIDSRASLLNPLFSGLLVVEDLPVKSNGWEFTNDLGQDLNFSTSLELYDPSNSRTSTDFLTHLAPDVPQVGHPDLVFEESEDSLLSASLRKPPSPTNEVVFIDAAVENYAEVIKSIDAGVEVVVLSPDKDGVEQVTNYLQRRTGLSAIHIFSHGASGNVALGSSLLNLGTLNDYQEQLKLWSASLIETGDLLIYGCEVADDAEGKAFLEKLHALVGVDVAASDDLTGSSALGGDWLLEETIGVIDSHQALQWTFLKNAQVLLANSPPTFTSGSSVTVAEAQTSVTTLTAEDLEGDTLTYSINNGVDSSGSDASQFTLDSSTGDLSFLTAPDHETPVDVDSDNVYEVEVAVTDGQGGSASQLVQVTVTDVTESMGFVVSGSKENVIELGGLWQQGDGYIHQQGTSKYLYANTPIAAGDFSITSTLSLIKLNRTAASFEIDGNRFGFEGGQRRFFTEGEDWGATQHYALTSDFITPGESFEFNVYRQGTELFFVINNTLIATETLHSEKLNHVGFRPWRNTMRLYDFAFAEPIANTAPSLTSAATVTVGENETRVMTVTAVDPDAGAVLAYGLSGGADASQFTLDSSTGDLSFLTAPDHEAPVDVDSDNVYEVEVAVTDGQGGSASQLVQVTVTDVDEVPINTAPSLTSAATVTVGENETRVMTVTAVDPDAGAVLAYGLSGGADASQFTLDSSTGDLSFLTAPDHEAPVDVDSDNVYKVEVAVTDGQGGSASQLVQVTVTDVDEVPINTAPSLTSAATVTVGENETRVMTVTAVDPDAGAVLAYGLSGGADASQFTLDSSTGDLSFLTAPDHETPVDVDSDNVYEVEVAVTDGQGGSASQLVQVTVTDVDEVPINTAPSLTSAATVTVGENETRVMTVTAVDPDAGAVLAYGLSGGADASQFTLDSSTGDLSFLTAPDHETPVDVDSDNVYEVEVAVTDGQGGSASQLVQVTVTDVDEVPINTAPSLTSAATVTVGENETRVMTVTAVDPDAGAVLAYGLSGGADASQFTLDSSTGDLSFLTAPDHETPVDVDSDNVYEVEVAVTDGQGGSASQLVQVTVTDVTESMGFVVSGSKENVIELGGLWQQGDGYIHQQGTSKYLYANTPIAAGDFSITSTLSLIKLNRTAASFEIDGNRFGFEGGQRRFFTEGEDWGATQHYALTSDFITPGESFEFNVYRQGTELFFVINNTLIATETLHSEKLNHVGFRPWRNTMRLYDFAFAEPIANTAPSLTSAATVTVGENETRVMTVTAVDPDAGAVLAYGLSGGADASQFTLDSSTGDLSFLTAPDHEAPVDVDSDNVYEVEVAVTDGQGGSASQLVQVTVTDVDEVPINTDPTIISSDTVSLAENSTDVITLLATDSDASDILHYVISGGVDAALFTIDSASGDLNFITAPNYEEPTDTGGDNQYEVQVDVSDGQGGSDSQNLIVTIANVFEGSNFVTSGSRNDVIEIGGAWEQSNGYIEQKSPGKYLYAGETTGTGDFFIRATLSLIKLNRTAASFEIDGNRFGFDGGQSRFFTEGEDWGAIQHHALTSDFITPGHSFEFQVNRQGTDLSFFVNGILITTETIHEGSLVNVGFRPWRNTMRLYDFSIEQETSEPPGVSQFFDDDPVFINGTNGYHAYRIPAVTRAGNGDLLTFAEGRVDSFSDHGNIDIVMRRSTDNGLTWNPLSVLVDYGIHTAGNPGVVVDTQNNNRLVMVYNTSAHSETEIVQGEGAREVWVMTSDDHGYTWSAPVNITESVHRPNAPEVDPDYTYSEDWRWHAVLPGHAIQLDSGRLLFGANYKLEDNLSQAFSFYSDDHGATWEIGGIAGYPGNENQIVQLSDGTLMMNARPHSNHNELYRQISYSNDGGETWSGFESDTALPDPRVHGSIFGFESDQTYRLLFSNPASKTHRKNLTVRLSYDDGDSWSYSRRVWAGLSAYSDLVLQSDNLIGLLYEAGDELQGRNRDQDFIRYARFNLNWLTQGQDLWT
jgi:hypothetical protein